MISLTTITVMALLIKQQVFAAVAPSLASAAAFGAFTINGAI
jgi:hypothetical protein